MSFSERQPEDRPEMNYPTTSSRDIKDKFLSQVAMTDVTIKETPRFIELSVKGDTGSKIEYGAIWEEDR